MKQEDIEAALLNACASAREEIVDVLLERGVSPNSLSEWGASALHLLISAGRSNAPRQEWERRIRIAETLLNKGIDANIRWYDETPLLAATNLHEFAMHRFVDLLLPHNQDWLTTAKGGITLLHRAARIGHSPLLRACLEHLPVDVRDAEGGTPLLYASYRGRAQTCLMLLESGADPNAITDDGSTPMHRFCTYDLNAGLKTRNDPQAPPGEILEILLDAGADINAIDNSGKTPLDHAIESQDLIRDVPTRRRAETLQEYGAKTSKGSGIPGKI